MHSAETKPYHMPSDLTLPGLSQISEIQQPAWAPTKFVFMGYTEQQQQFSLCFSNVSSRVTNDVTPLYLLHQYAQKRGEGNLKQPNKIAIWRPGMC